MAAMALVAFLVGGTITWLELVTSKYPQTVRLFWRHSPSLWTYALIYGLIAAGFTLAYPWLAENGVLKIMAGAGNPQNPAVGSEPTFLVAVILGLCVKALLHIRLFSVPSGDKGETFPIGTESITRLFEPTLLKKITFDDHERVTAFLQPLAAAHTNLEEVKKKIKDNLPMLLENPTRDAFIVDLDKTDSVKGALEVFLRAFGVNLIKQLFDPPRPPKIPLPPPVPPSPPPPPFLPPDPTGPVAR